MAKEKKLVEAITSMEADFAQWYTDVVKKAELIDYSSVKGCMIIKPAGYANLGKYSKGNWMRVLKKPALKCIYAAVYPGKSSSGRKRSCRRICT